MRAAALACLLGVLAARQDDPVLQEVDRLRVALDFERAEERLRAALASAPPSRQRAESHVEMLLRTQQPELALEEGKRWLEAYPASGLLHVYVGDSLFRARRLEDAAEHYRAALGDEAAGSAARGNLQRIEHENRLAEHARDLEARAVWVTAACAAASLALLFAVGLRLRAARTH